MQAISVGSGYHHNVFSNRHKKLQLSRKSETHPCYHIGGSHIKENIPVIEAKDVTGKEMILGMLQYIWPKVGAHFKNDNSKNIY